MSTLPGRLNSEVTSNALIPKNGLLGSPSADDASSALLQIFDKAVEDIRGLVTCRICVRPMYEPYMISCGHTFCYSCLSQWFCNHKTNKTCPDCRAAVKQQPAPAYVVREMTQILISRAELIPVGEDTVGHSESKQEEAAIVERDRSNQDRRVGGLFRGCFNHSLIPGQAPILDDEDGVERCPTCTWELEEGWCSQCEMSYDRGSLYGSEPSDFDESEIETDAIVSDNVHVHIPPNNGWNPPIGSRQRGQADDISLDGDGFGLHAPNYNGDLYFGRAAAQSLIGRPARRNGSPTAAQIGRHYAPSMLSDVATTYDGEDMYDVGDEPYYGNDHSFGNGLSDDNSDGEEDDGDHEDDSEDDSSLSDFIVNDEDGEGQTSRCRINRRLASGLPEDAHTHDHVHHQESAMGERPTQRFTVYDSADDSDETPSRGENGDKLVNVSDSDSESGYEVAIPSMPSRKRGRVVLEDTSEEDDPSDTDSERSRPRRKLSSSGSATVGRQSPVFESSRAIPARPATSSKRRSTPIPSQMTEDSDLDSDSDSGSDSDLPPLSPVNTRQARNAEARGRRHRRRSNHRQTSALADESNNPGQVATYPNNVMLYNGSHFSRMQADLQPQPLSIRSGSGQSQRRQRLSHRR